MKPIVLKSIILFIQFIGLAQICTGQQYLQNGGKNTIKSNWPATASSSAATELTSLLTEQWDTTISKWVSSNLINYYYNKAQNITSDVSLEWISNAWVNQSRDSFVYNAGGGQVLHTNQQWDSTSWQNSNKDTFGYDTNGRLVLSIQAGWNTSSYLNSVKITDTFSGNTQIQTQYSWISNAWQPTSQDIYSMNTAGKDTQDLNKQWSGGWANAALTKTSYNSSGMPISILNSQWTGSAWLPSTLEKRSYDANGNDTLDVFQNWAVSNQWVYSYVTESKFTYNSSNSITGETQKYSLNDTLWTPINQNNGYTYNGSGSLTQYVNQDWNNGWVNNTRYTFTYQTVTGINSQGTRILGLKAYPNPFVNSINILVPQTTLNAASVSLTDISGKIVQEFSSVSPGAAISLGGQLPAGIYFVKCIEGNNVYIAKIVKAE